MKFISSVKSAFIKASNSRQINRKKLATSYVSLFLAFLILVSGTISWFTFRDNASVDSDTFSLETASALRVNEGEDLSNHIRLDDINLDEASSVDGRNMFFTTTGTFTDITSESVFREGNVGDKNQKYIYKDFKLTGSSDNTITEVYVKGYKITVGDEVFNGSTEIKYVDGKPTNVVKNEECPVRIAFIKETSQNTPVVIDPTALVSQYANTYKAVESTDYNGSANVAESKSDPFSKYYYVLGTPMFKLKGREPLNVTMVVWLEGTENAKTGKSNSKNYAGKNISVDIELESNWTDMEMVTFVDSTIYDNQPLTDLSDPSKLQQWIGSDNHLVTMTYTDVTTTDNKGKHPVRTVVMSPTKWRDDGRPIEWEAPIPKDVVTDITFNRYDNSNVIIYNAWYTKNGVEKMWAGGGDEKIQKPYDLQDTRVVNDVRQLVYTAVRGHGYNNTTDETKRLSPCAGYWGYDQLSGINRSDAESRSNQNVSLGITLNTGANSDIESYANNEYTMYVEMIDRTVHEIPHTGENTFKLSNFEVSAGSIIKAFYLKKENDAIPLSLLQQVSVRSNSTYTFNLNNNSILEKQK